MQSSDKGGFAIKPSSFSGFLFLCCTEHIRFHELYELSLVLTQPNATHEPGYPDLLDKLKQVYLLVEFLDALFVNFFLLSQSAIPSAT